MTFGFPDVRLLKRKAGAAYTGRVCASCGTTFAGDTNIVVAKERGEYMAEGWKLYHRVCHHGVTEAQMATFVTQLSRQIAALTDD